MATLAHRCAACTVVVTSQEAAFTAECAHVFHPHCASGHSACPSCHALWRTTPFFTPAAFVFSGLPPRAVHPIALPRSKCAACNALVAASSSFRSHCHHTFHLTCVAGNICPVCAARWPYDVSSSSYTNFHHVHNHNPPPPMAFPPKPMVFPTFAKQPLPMVYDDDEPVELPAPPAPMDDWDLVEDAAKGGGKLVLDAHCELPAVARGEPHDNFVVLVHAKAPGAVTAAAAAAQPRAPLDLVTVLDVSGSMTGQKIALLKKAMDFVVDQLAPADRLSVVAFSTDASRVIPLTCMSDAGKVKAKYAVQSLNASGGTNILKGLTEAAKVLDGRRHKNAVASVILLSDGQDTYNLGGGGGYYGYNSGSYSKNYRALVPGSLLSGAGHRSTPIHTFGFGADHDSSAMHTIAEETGGTFSFIEDERVVQDSFAQCIGGLLSVAVQEAMITVKCVHPVRVRAVKSGRYDSNIDAYARSATVDVGELYADEERRFLVLVQVPKAGEADEVTQLMKVSCTYRDTATGQVVDVATGEDVAVQRPVELAKDQQQPSMEVAREKFRVEATEDIAAARAAAERGEYAEAARMLERRKEALLPALADDGRCKALVEELRELSTRVASQREYEKTGRACLLTGYSSHAQQRAASAFVAGAAVYGCPAPGAAMGGGGGGAAAPTCGFGAAGAYATPAMQRMVGASRQQREQQQQPEPSKRKTGGNGGKSSGRW